MRLTDYGKLQHGAATPALTIVTPTIDRSRYIDEALASVRAQQCHLVEHIIVHDGSTSFVDRLRASFPDIVTVLGEGRGATAAVALGIARARAPFTLLFNSDDRLVPGAINAFFTASRARPQVRIWSGGTRIFRVDPDGTEITLRTVDDRASTDLSLENVLDDLPLMTARFIHRDIYTAVGPLDANYSACSDREFMLRVALAGPLEAPLAHRIVDMRFHAESATINDSTGRVPRYLAEHLGIARRFVRSPERGGPERGVVRDWHARETLRKAAYELRNRRFSESVATVMQATRDDWTWPWRARTFVAAIRRRRRGQN